MLDNSVMSDPARQSLIDWRQDLNGMSSKNPLTRWHKGQVSNRLPNKTQVDMLQMDAVGQGWMPSQPIIFPDSRVVAVGSCFAGYFILWLADHGFNTKIQQSPYNALLRFGSEFENVAVIAQQFRWAFGELDEISLSWIDKNKTFFEATEERRQLVKDTLLNTDVLLITLGLSEVWYDRQSGEPMWRAITSDQFNPEQHVFKVESMEQTLHWLNTIERLRDQYMPHMKIIFTLSPVRFSATFRTVSAFTANNASKAILRAALDEFLRAHSQKLNQNLFYFPSYEFVMEYFIDSFEQDNRHVLATVVTHVINYFVNYYCSDHMKSINNNEQSSAAIVSKTPQAELLARIKLLEDQVSKLQKICDERLVVIEELDKAAKDRLELINYLEKNKQSVKWFWFFIKKILKL